MSWEIEFLNSIQHLLRNEFLDAVMPFISSLGNAGIFWILLTVVLLIIPKTRKAGVASAIALVLMLVTGNMILKPLIARLRPFTVNTAIELLIPPPSDFSFPSGHTFALSHRCILRTAARHSGRTDRQLCSRKAFLPAAPAGLIPVCFFFFYI